MPCHLHLSLWHCSHLFSPFSTVSHLRSVSNFINPQHNCFFLPEFTEFGTEFAQRCSLVAFEVLILSASSPFDDVAVPPKLVHRCGRLLRLRLSLFRSVGAYDVTSQGRCTGGRCWFRPIHASARTATDEPNSTTWGVWCAQGESKRRISGVKGS